MLTGSYRAQVLLGLHGRLFIWRTGTHTVSTSSQSNAPQALITGVWNEAPLKWITFIKMVLRDRCLCWWGDQKHKCLNKQLSRFFFLFPSLRETPLWPPLRLQQPDCESHLPPTLNILIMDEIHLYVAIIVPNCFFEGSEASSIWLTYGFMLVRVTLSPAGNCGPISSLLPI